MIPIASFLTLPAFTHFSSPKAPIGMSIRCYVLISGSTIRPFLYFPSIPIPYRFRAIVSIHIYSNLLP